MNDDAFMWQALWFGLGVFAVFLLFAWVMRPFGKPVRRPETREAYFVRDGQPVKVTYPTTTTVTYETVTDDRSDATPSDS